MRFRFFQSRPRRKENARFRHRRDARLAVQVPLSRKEIRLRRQARTRAMVRWGLVTVACLAALLYIRSIWRQAFRGNPEFAVGRFEYHSNGGITARQAAAAAGLRMDMNLMEVDLSDIRARLMELPRVKNVHVARRLPDRLAIDIEERLPVAWITSVESGRVVNIEQKHRLFLDRDGVVIKCEELLREYMTLPVINAVDQPVLTLGKELASAPAKAALTLLEEIRSRDWAVPCSVSRIDIHNPWTLSAEMESGAVYTFRPDRLPQQLDRLEFILARIKAHPSGRTVASVNLQMERNVPVRFFDQIAGEEEELVHRPGTAVPLTEARNVNFAPPPARSGARSAPVPAAKNSRKPAPAARQERDIQSILSQ